MQDSLALSLGRLSLIAAAALIPALAVAASEEPLPMVFEEVAANGAPVKATAVGGTATPLPSAASRAACAVSVREVTDTRRNQASVGAAIFPQDEFGVNVAPAYYVALRAGSGAEWLRTGLKSMRRFGAEVTEKADAAGAPSIALKMAHTWSAGFNLNAHVMLITQVPGAAPRHYHGFGAKTNWNNGNGEFMTVLNAALNDALAGLAKDLAATCGN